MFVARLLCFLVGIALADFVSIFASRHAMSGFLYLAARILLRLQAFPPCRSLYVALGFVLGVGYLAKAPMLPIGSAILLLSLFVFKEWLPP
jgi:hypothetical protein